MWAAIIVGVLVLGLFVAVIAANHKPKPKQFSHDAPLYREMVAFLRKVAYYNDTSPEWTVLVPEDLAVEARALLDKEKKELRIRNEP